MYFLFLSYLLLYNLLFLLLSAIYTKINKVFLQQRLLKKTVGIHGVTLSVHMYEYLIFVVTFSSFIYNGTPLLAKGLYFGFPPISLGSSLRPVTQESFSAISLPPLRTAAPLTAILWHPLHGKEQYFIHKIIVNGDRSF